MSHSSVEKESFEEKDIEEKDIHEPEVRFGYLQTLRSLCLSGFAQVLRNDSLLKDMKVLEVQSGPYYDLRTSVI